MHVTPEQPFHSLTLVSRHLKHQALCLRLVYLLLISFSISSCTIVREGHVGVKRTLGRVKPYTYSPGVHAINPFLTRMYKVPITTRNLPLTFEALPSREGLSILSEFSVLYHIHPDSARTIVATIGINNAEAVLTAVTRSAAANVTSRFYAKDMHSSQRANIEGEIAKEMVRLLGNRGLIVEAVLLKTVRLPDGLTKAIEEKLGAEQEAQRMEFILNKEKQEAERRRIEAEGVRDAQKIIQQGLSPEIIQFRSIEALEKVAQSPNTKTIIMNGKTPFVLGNE
jgi:prohibitin 1